MGTYVDAKTGKRVSVGPRPLHNLLKKSILLLLVLPSISPLFAQSQLDMRVRAVQSGAWGIASATITTISPTATSVSDPLYVTMVDEQEGKYMQLSPTRELVVTEKIRLVGVAFSSNTFEEAFISSAVVAGGTVRVNNGCINLYTGTAPNASASIQTTRKARFMAGSPNEFRAITRLTLTTPTSGTNTRRWGAYNAQDGFFFEYTNGAFYVGSRKVGVDLKVATTSFTGTVPTLTANYTRFTITYTNVGAKFYVNDVLAHAITTTTTELTAMGNFPCSLDNTNSGGANTDHFIEIRVWTIMRLGAIESSPIFRNIKAAGTYILKRTAGTLMRITVNDIGASGSSIVIYDNSAGSGTTIASLDTAKMTLITLLYGVPFDNGLTIVATGTIGDITVVFE